jgi:hypothetical protein
MTQKKSLKYINAVIPENMFLHIAAWRMFFMREIYWNKTAQKFLPERDKTCETGRSADD